MANVSLIQEPVATVFALTACPLDGQYAPVLFIGRTRARRPRHRTNSAPRLSDNPGTETTFELQTEYGFS